MDSCTMYNTLEFIGKKWSLLIILVLYKDRTKWKRYSEIKKAVPGITPKMLSLRLKELENKKLIVKKKDVRKIPISCNYSLTEKSHGLMKVLKDLKNWAQETGISNQECDSTMCKYCDKKIR